jgi:arylsulfatase A-like enzyme
MPRRPNIVIITSDQHRGDSFGFERREVRTPHLDQLAREGTRFAACITPNVVCQPARASLLTGQLPLTHGVRDNGIDLPPRTGDRGFAGALSAGGYRTGFIGKAHFSTSHTFSPTGTPECRASTADYPPGWHGPYMGFEHVELVVEGHNQWLPMAPPAGQHYERWYYADGRGEEKNRLYREHALPDTGAVQTWHSALPVCWHNSTWIGDRSVRFIETHRGEPFCLWASFPDPHHPFDAPLPWSRLHASDEVTLPAHRTLDLERRPWWHAASLQSRQDPRVEKIRGDYLRYAPQTDAQLREIIANYYGMIALIDHHVGRIVGALDELDLADDTYVVFTSDHGEWLGDHGLLFKGPMHYEGLLRVGLVMRGPDVVANRVERSPVSLIDVAPTILEWAGCQPLLAQDGVSVASLASGRSDAREVAYNEWDLGPARCGVPLRLRTVRTDRYKLTLELDSGVGELYDLRDDADEMHNRFDDAAIAGVRRELTAAIERRPSERLAPRYEPSGMA